MPARARGGREPSGERLPCLDVAQREGQLALPRQVRQVRFNQAADIQVFHGLDTATARAQPHIVLRLGPAAPGAPDRGMVVRVLQAQWMHFSDELGCLTLIEGVGRCTVTGLETGMGGPGTLARCVPLPDEEIKDHNLGYAMLKTIRHQLARLARLNASALSEDLLHRVVSMTNETPFAQFIDFLAQAFADRDTKDFISRLAVEPCVAKRARIVMAHLDWVSEKEQIDHALRVRTREMQFRTHHDYELAEQAKVIMEEIHDGKDGLAGLREQAAKVGLPPKARDKVFAEIARLDQMSPAMTEAVTVRSYIETILSLPWSARSALRDDIQAAKAILDEDHHGIEQVKERILEHLAVQRRNPRQHGGVLCLSGPPGVGKTSLGRSVARATGREFIRVPLGGVYDEAFIRGHRKTYVASMPGRILTSLAKVKVRNPVFMLDEFDKVGATHSSHGDPAAALLEVLDPEHNHAFTDHFVELEFDLSEVMFIATANTDWKLPAALRDRMEIIRLPGYTASEKMVIARRHLLPRQLGLHGLKPTELRLDDKVLQAIIHDYSNEAGVRELERSIAKLCRKVVVERDGARGPGRPKAVTRARMRTLLEVPEHYETFATPSRPTVGCTTGMVYGVGACRMEAVTHEAEKAGFHVTGIDKAKEVRALASVAVSLLQARHGHLGLDAGFARKRNVHIHLQDQAAVPFGPLGLGLFVLLASAFTRRPLRPEVALLGEINLRGDVFGSEHYSEYKATVMDAMRKGISTIVIPAEDAHLLADLPVELKAAVRCIEVRDVWTALDSVLVTTRATRSAPRARAAAVPAADRPSVN